MKTRLETSRDGCSSRQVSRAALTSGLPCSDACRVFFEAPADMAEIAVEPGSAGFDSPLGEFYDQLVQSCIRRAPHKLAHQRVMGGKLVFAIPTHALRLIYFWIDHVHEFGLYKLIVIRAAVWPVLRPTASISSRRK